MGNLLEEGLIFYHWGDGATGGGAAGKAHDEAHREQQIVGPNSMKWLDTMKKVAETDHQLSQRGHAEWDQFFPPSTPEPQKQTTE